MRVLVAGLLAGGCGFDTAPPGASGTGGQPAAGSGGTPMASGGSPGSGGQGQADAAPDTAGADGGDSDVYIAERPADAPGILIHVSNACPFELWIHGAGQGAVLQPDNVRLATGASQDYVAPEAWPAARVTAYLGMPPQGEIDKVEMTLEKKVDLGVMKKIINYNITYVDWLALPMEMIAIGTGLDCKRVTCQVPEAEVLAGCPDGLLSGKRCLSAGTYCSDPVNQSKPFCHVFDAQIAQCAGDAQKYPMCAGAAGATTPQVYACAGGFFSQSPKWCAALNRGMLDEPDNGDITRYYKTDPHNIYSKWVHSTCPGIYAFPYDDYGRSNESGFHSCTGATQLNITFCPAG